MDLKDITVKIGNESDSLTVTDTLTDTMNYNSYDYALSSQGIDTITLDDLNISSSTITLPSTYITNNTGIGIGGSGGIYNTTTSGYTWTQPYTPTVNITNDGVAVQQGADIKIGNRSMKEFMIKVEERLAILVPDPERLEKFESLKRAYEHYKTMEALCFPDEKDKKNEC